MESIVRWGAAIHRAELLSSNDGINLRATLKSPGASGDELRFLEKKKTPGR